MTRCVSSLIISWVITVDLAGSITSVTQGRDTLFFLRNGFEICAVDYSEKGLEDLRNRAERLGVGPVIQTVCHDVRRLLPFNANTFDACFLHMLYCMALTTAELETL